MQKKRILMLAAIVSLSLDLAGCNRYPRERLFPDEKKTGFGVDDIEATKAPQAGLGQPVMPEGVLGSNIGEIPQPKQQQGQQLTPEQQQMVIQELQLTQQQQQQMAAGQQVQLTPEQQQKWKQLQQQMNQQQGGQQVPQQTTPQKPATTPQEPIDTSELKEGTYTATIQTGAGDITLTLYQDEAPQTVANFIKKAQTGFYKGLKFHRVEDWVIQGGDPKGDGTGGGTMPTELNEKPFVKGSLGVARGTNREISNDSQFFICTTDCDWLTGDYTNFGEVTMGMEVAEMIEKGETIEDIVIEHES